MKKYFCLAVNKTLIFFRQLFEIYETLPNASLEKMNYVVRSAVNICVCVYIMVGFFGYVAFVNYPFTGNILMSFSPSLMTDAMKIGFVLSVACSFPLVIFPCRASLYSLLFKKVITHNYFSPFFISITLIKFFRGICILMKDRQTLYQKIVSNF